MPDNRVIAAALDIAGGYTSALLSPSYGVMLAPTLLKLGALMHKVEHLANDDGDMVQKPF